MVIFMQYAFSLASEREREISRSGGMNYDEFAQTPTEAMVSCKKILYQR
jgi:hypothetical protein